MLLNDGYKYDVFLCYSRRNRRFVRRLADALADSNIHFFLDTLEIDVGDTPRQRIEDAIEQSRYFCLAISRASMTSFYVRELEIEHAYQKMIRTRRRDFILPILLERVEVPPWLATIQYLSFTQSRNYMDNVRKLIRKITLDDDAFTGELLYKNVETSTTGEMFGTGKPLKQVPKRGYAVRAGFEDGRIVRMTTYMDGGADAQKRVSYDKQGRVRDIEMSRHGKVVDTWRYVYDPNTGKRATKLFFRPGEMPFMRQDFDASGRKRREIEYGPRKQVEKYFDDAKPSDGEARGDVG